VERTEASSSADLVVVANIQAENLKTEVEKVSMGTVIGHGLVGPKSDDNSVH